MRRLLVGAGAVTVVAGSVVVAVVVAGGLASTARTVGAPETVPGELTWRVASSCMAELDGTGPAEVGWSDDGVFVNFMEDHPGNAAAEERMRACFSQYRLDPRPESFSYVNAYERARLFDYYTRTTRPCLSSNGFEAPAIPRSDFFTPDERPWNPYTAMGDVPLDRVIELYQACPPVPRSLLALHER